MTQSTVTDFDFGFDDRFASVPGEEAAQIPYAQLMTPGRGEWGLGIKEEQAEAVGFEPDKTWRKIEHRFKGASDPTPMFITRTPIMSFIKMGERMFHARSDKRDVYSFRQDYRKYNGEHYKPFTKTLIMLYGLDRQRLMSTPLQLTCSGATGTALTKSFDLFVGQAQSAVKTTFSAAMKSHLIFALTFKVDEAGQEKKSEIIVPSGWVEPTPENRSMWQIPTKVRGEDNELSLLILALREQYADFGKFSQPQATTAPTEQYAVTPDDGSEYEYGEPPY